MKGVSGATLYDLVVIGLFVLLIGRGLWLGLLKQVTGLLALYLAFFAAGQYHDRIFPFLRDISTNPKVIFLTSYVLLFIATYVVVMLCGKALSFVLKLTITSWFDSLLGALVGFAKAVILVVIMHVILGSVLAPENQMLRTCVTCETLNGAADLTRELIRNEELRKTLMQEKPAIAIDAVKEFLSPSGPEKKTPTDKP
ncbi:MAG: CvpA family protein [Proteobacteria bacterium]|nr:CvpA family protein [Pseudomonadota bacterium]